MLTVILIIILFASLVILHEWGHFVAARRNGVEVEEFGIGFIYRLWAKKVGKTIYSINVLPLGGFVRLKGEDSNDTGKGTFASASIGAKTKILLAGVAVNILTCFVMVYVLCLTGLPALSGGFEPSFLHSSYAQPKQLILVDVVPGSPAASVGLKRGDYVLDGNGKALATDDDLRNFTKDNAGKIVTLTVRSAGDERDVTVKLRGPNVTSGYLGVESQQVYKLKYDPLSAVAAAAYVTGALFVATVVGVVKLILSIPVLIMGLFAKGVPAQADQASGPIGIFFLFEGVTALGLSYLFLLMANIAAALAAFNVMPIPALDGGRLAIIWVEKLRGRKIQPETEARIHAIGFMALIAFVVLISVYDLRKQFGG